MKIAILAIGKVRSRSLRELIADYAERLRHYLPFEIIPCRDESQALKKIETGDLLVVLDERGKQKSSAELAGFLAEHQMRGTKRLVFFIGGEEGTGEAVKKRAELFLGLSRMTLPHEMAQLILAEQLYRACSISRGEPYHRGDGERRTG